MTPRSLGPLPLGPRTLTEPTCHDALEPEPDPESGTSGDPIGKWVPRTSPPSRRAAQSSQQVHPNKRDMYNICSWTGYSRSHGQMRSYFEILEPLRSPTSRIDFFPTADRAHHSAHRAPHGCSRKGETACPTSQPVSPLHRMYTVYSTALIARETQDAT